MAKRRKLYCTNANIKHKWNKKLTSIIQTCELLLFNLVQLNNWNDFKVNELAVEFSKKSKKAF